MKKQILISLNLKHNNPIAAFKKGWDEFMEGTTTHYGSFLIFFYDIGRELHDRKMKRKSAKQS